MNRFRNENNAFQSLHAFTVYDSGMVPKYDPSCHQAWLKGFINDKFHPSAILLEYLTDPEPLNCVNYSKERYSTAMEALAQVHNARVVHNDKHMGLEGVHCHEYEVNILRCFGEKLVCLISSPSLQRVTLTSRLGGISKGGAPPQHGVLLTRILLLLT